MSSLQGAAVGHFGVLVSQGWHRGRGAFIRVLFIVVNDGGERLLRLEKVLVVKTLSRSQPPAAAACLSCRVCLRTAAGSLTRPDFRLGQVSGRRLVSPLVRVVLGVGGAPLAVAHLHGSPAGQDGGHVRPAEPGALARRPRGRLLGLRLLLLLNLFQSYAWNEKNNMLKCVGNLYFVL